MTTYFKNQKVRCSAAFTVNSVATDPTAVTFKVRTPALVTTTYTYGVGVVIVKDSTGNYHADVTANEAGEWLVGWTGTGTCEAVDEDSFMAITYF